MDKKRILFISDSIKRKTGYSTVSKNIIQRLLPTDKYHIAQLGFGDIPEQLPLDIDYYSQIKDHTKCCGKNHVIEHRTTTDPTIKYIISDVNNPLHDNQKLCLKGQNVMADNYGYDSCYFVIQHFKPDIVIAINDIWGLYNINYIKNRKAFKYVPYLAIDSECLFPGLTLPNKRNGLPDLNVIESINNCDEVIVFTNWAVKTLNKLSNVTIGKKFENLSVIPHGVDTDIWKPLDESKVELKKKHFNLDSNTFLLGSIGRNQPRKMHYATLKALRYFIDHYEKSDKKVHLYYHMSLDDDMGWPMKWLAKYYNVEDRVIFNEKLRPGIGPDDEELNEISNCFDAHILLSNSEGWGLPLLETAAAGIPNITTKYSAHGDWGKDTFNFCKTAEYEHEPKTGFIKAIPDTKDAAKQIMLLYNNSKYYNEYKKKCLKLRNNLDWDIIVDKWINKLDSIDTSSLDPNRYDNPEMKPQDPNDMTLTVFPSKKETKEN